MEKVSALRIVQEGLGTEGASGLTIYITGMTLTQLNKYVYVDVWGPENDGGYQRPLAERRLKEIAKYIQREQSVLPTSVLVGTRPDDEPNIEPVGFSDDPSAISVGELCFPEGATLWVIDGQHRLRGVNYAYEHGAEHLGNYPFPVCVMWDVERYSEMLHFNTINTQQKKMQTDIADRHLVKRQSVEGDRMLALGSRGEKDYLRATATRITDRLNDTPGVWQHQIGIPGVKGRDKGLVRQHAMVVSIEPFLKDSWVRQVTDDDKAKVLVNFWDAAKDVWSEAFENPNDYRVQATVGIYSLNALLPVLIQRCLEDQDLTKEKMSELIGKMDIDSDFWHKEDGHPLTLGTGMASIRALSHHLVSRIPRRESAGLKI